MENKQTSIEWLFHKLWNEPKDKMVWYALLNKAKQIHKEEIEDAYLQGVDDERNTNTGISAEVYYIETYERKTTENK